MALNDAVTTIIQFNGTASLCLSVPEGPQNTTGPEEGTLHRIPSDDLEAFSQLAQHSGGACHAIVPRHEATLRILTVPSQDAEEIAAMVTLSAADWVPYPIEEMQVLHQSLARLEDGASRVLVVLIRRATIEEHIAAHRRAGFEPVQLSLSTACLVATASTLVDAGDFALLHIDPAALELIVMRDGELCFSRGVAHGQAWTMDTPSGREALAYEVRDLLAAYRRESDDGLGVNRIHLSVHGPALDDAAALLSEATRKEYLETDTGILLSSTGQMCPATLAGAIIMARGNTPLDLPLAPPALAQQLALRSVQRHLVRGAALAGILVVALLIWYGQAVWQRKNLIADLQRRMDTIAPSAEGVAAKQHGLQIISRQVERGGSFLELLAGLAAAAPRAELNITRIQYERDSGLTLWGRATTKDRVLKDFLGGMRERALGNLAVFAHAHSLYETAGVERNTPIVNYQITIPFPEDDDESEVIHAR